MNLLINELTPELKELVRYKKTGNQASKANRQFETALADDEVSKILSVLDPDTDYESWLRIGMALHSHGCNFEIWDDWSSEGEKYEPSVCANTWDSFSENGDVTIGTLIYMAKEAGYEFNFKPNLIQEDRPKLVPWSELSDLPKRSHLMKGFIDEGAFSMVYGASNSGKTFYALDLACHVALGWQWHGKNTKQGTVVYVAGEGGLGISERLEAFRTHHGLEEGKNLLIWPRPLNLAGNSQDIDGFLASLKEPPDIKLIIVDTVARSLGSADENSSSAMGDFVKNCDLIRENTGAHVMVIHHTGKDEKKGARGSSALKAAVDTEIEIVQKNGTIISTVKKQRDGKTGDKNYFKFQSCHVGNDEDGDPISSCVIINDDVIAHLPSLFGQPLKALKILKNLIEKNNIFSPTNSENLKVSLDVFKEQCKQEDFSSSDNPDSFNKAFSRARNTLREQGYTEELEGFIYLKDKEDKDRLVL